MRRREECDLAEVKALQRPPSFVPSVVLPLEFLVRDLERQGGMACSASGELILQPGKEIESRIPWFGLLEGHGNTHV